jgi:hypothetical protein
VTLTEFEMHAHKVFAERLPIIRDASDAEAERLTDELFNELEVVAIGGGVEVCSGGAYLLTFALYILHLSMNAERLGVGPDYFDGDRTPEQEAYMYLHERRCGLPARHNDLPVQ